jgi:hypothetical protein
MLSKVELLKKQVGHNVEVETEGNATTVVLNTQSDWKLTSVGSDIFETTRADGKKGFYSISHVISIIL